MMPTTASTHKITVIIPCRPTEDAEVTLSSLEKQTFKNFKVVVVYDREKKGAPWARNEGFKQCDTEFVLFSDNDINWKPNAIEILYQTLNRFRLASYAYGRFKIGDVIWGHEMFDPVKLCRQNYISTMSLIRTADFPKEGWDESLKRFQDWDLFLTMLKEGKRGVYCNELLFTSEHRVGISHGGQDVDSAARAINNKHKLGLPGLDTGYL